MKITKQQLQQLIREELEADFRPDEELTDTTLSPEEPGDIERSQLFQDLLAMRIAWEGAKSDEGKMYRDELGVLIDRYVS